MDRIRKALDLAREARGEELSPGARPSSDALRARRAALLPVSISYTSTQIFDPERAALEAFKVFAADAPSQAAESFRFLRTQVLQRMQDKGLHTLGVVSPGPREGKTFTAVNLAIQLAADRRHTALLVDYDLARPKVAASFGLDTVAGVDDLLTHGSDVDLTCCLYHPATFERLVLLPASGAVPGAVSIGGPRSLELIEELKARYPDRIVLFDLPPVLSTDDAVAVAPHLDAVLVVVAEGQTRRADLLRCLELLQRTTIVGTVLNRASEIPTGRG